MRKFYSVTLHNGHAYLVWTTDHIRAAALVIARTRWSPDYVLHYKEIAAVPDASDLVMSQFELTDYYRSADHRAIADAVAAMSAPA